MEDKFVRICWNTRGWRYPSGDVAISETPDTYASKHGFGHEEWLFNFGWTINGYRYGYLQPIGKYYETYSGDNCSILLYTYTLDRECLLIGKINNAHVPSIEELNRVLNISKENGWLQEMLDDVKRIGGKPSALSNPEPQSISNIRFRPEDVQIFDPRPRVVGDHVIANQRRYHPYNWHKNYPKVETHPPLAEPTITMRSEHERTRAAQDATTYEPRHVLLQNRLHKYLCCKHGRENVLYEHNYVDLILREPDGDVFFEIKLETTVKRCIRVALGQLLEYAMYPDSCLASRLIVVGYPKVDAKDRTYLAELRRRFRLPVYYWQFSSESNQLIDEA